MADTSHEQLDELITRKVREELAKYRHQVESNEPPLYKSDDFTVWFTNFTTKAKTFYLSVLAVPGVTAIFALLLKTIQFGKPTFEWLLAGMLFLQSLVIFILYALIRSPRPLTDTAAQHIGKSLSGKYGGGESYLYLEPERLKKAHDVSVKFSRMWGFAWLAWGILYFVLGVIILWSLTTPKQPFTLGDNIGQLQKLSWLTGFFNNLSTVFLYMCYRELAFPTKSKWKDEKETLVLLIIVIGMVAISHLVASAHPENAASAIPGWVGSFAAGTVIALLVGRLESKFVDPPVVVTAALYIYAAIQGSFVIFPEDPPLMLALTSAAFFFKIILFLLIAWLLGSRVMTFYLAQIAVIHEIIPDRKKDFVEAMQDVERENISQKQPRTIPAQGGA